MIRRSLQLVFLAIFAFLFFHVCCPYPAEPEKEPQGFPSHYADSLTQKERLLHAETFLIIDPSVALSASIAERQWNPRMIGAVLIVVICLLVPRAFCGYVCPLGTIIDITDRMINKIKLAIFRRKTTYRSPGRLQTNPLRYLKYVLLGIIVAAAVFGVSFAGYLAPMPIVTRAFVFLLAPIQTAYYRDWYQVPLPNVGVIISIVFFAGILAFGLLQRRFWCRYLCPTGAIFSLVGFVRIFGRKIDMQKCNGCARCVPACKLGVISPQNIVNTHTECISCLECQSRCPTGAVSFGLNNRAKQRDANIVPELTGERRRFIQGILFSVSTIFGILAVRSWFNSNKEHNTLIRPPGSVPEEIFLKRCVRCGECLRACPNDALQSCGLEFGEDRMWTPRLVADWSGCEPSCNNCGRVCPTGAIHELPLEEKRACRIGLAVVEKQTCLPYTGKEECQICVDECRKAGYNAIEFMRVGTELDENGMPIDESGFLAPVVLPDKCVGCGLCQTRCRAINATQKKLLHQSAILVIAGNHEDRLLTGSYRAMREQENNDNITTPETVEEDYLPDFLQ